MASSGLFAANAQVDTVTTCSVRTIFFNMVLSTSATFMGVIVSPVPAWVIIRPDGTGKCIIGKDVVLMLFQHMGVSVSQNMAQSSSNHWSP